MILAKPFEESPLQWEFSFNHEQKAQVMTARAGHFMREQDSLLKFLDYKLNLPTTSSLACAIADGFYEFAGNFQFLTRFFVRRH
ncbi:MAG TPA: hypothetical protein VHG89_10280 [Verrucomicrobiae bacterium]|nr:hypothetical protein [Verrucomicrobiae bacterium]